MNDATVDIMNRVSGLITQAEIRMIERGLCTPAKHESLIWQKSGRKFRICVAESGHLAEQPFDVKATLVHLIPGLLEESKKAQVERLRCIDPAELKKIEDSILDL